MLRALFTFALLALLAPQSQAGLITPDSIPRPAPNTLPSDPGTPVPAADLVTDQYAGLGLRFPVELVSHDAANAIAIASIDGVNVWAGVVQARVGDTWHSTLPMNALSVVSGVLTSPVNGLGIDFTWQGSGFGYLTATTRDGTELHTFVGGDTGTHRASLQGSDIVSFYALAVTQAPTARSGQPHPSGGEPFIWGVSGVEVQQVLTPEPTSLGLAGMGLLGMMGWYRRSRPGTRSPSNG